MSDESPKPTVVIVGAGFAGVACAKELAKHDVPVTLLDRHNYQQFQPLLYQVATASSEQPTSPGPSARSLPRTRPSRCVSST